MTVKPGRLNCCKREANLRKEKRKPMKNKSILAMTVFAVCTLAAVPISAAEISGDSLEMVETLSYIVDFVDDDGNILDSKICTYGDVLKDIRIPEQREDEQYIYQFAGWEPQVQEVVTESALYTAVYRRISKVDGKVSDVMPREIPEEIPAASVSEDFYPEKEVRQVTSTSYDVIPFHIETEEEPDGVNGQKEQSSEPSVFVNVIPEIIFPEEEKTFDGDEWVNERIAVLSEEMSKAIPEETPIKPENYPVVLTEVHSPAEISDPADKPADVEVSAVNVDESEPKTSAVLEKTVKKKENKSQRRNQSPPTKNADIEVSTLSESKQETGNLFSIPVFLAGAIVGGVVCMKARRAL